jgi:hypothetical protein
MKIVDISNPIINSTRKNPLLPFTFLYPWKNNGFELKSHVDYTDKVKIDATDS